MATPTSVWGIDIGQCALKALRLRQTDEGALQVEALDVVEHPRILSEPDVDKAQSVRTALETFLSRNSVTNSIVAVAVSGQSGFTRFVKLPPVESKKIPDIVRFEAEQQIPFPIDEVVWRWQSFHNPNNPDVEVGIFAMRRTDIAEMLSHFDQAELKVDVVQMSPLALFNFMTFDEHLASDGATLLADVGAQTTDLVVGDGPRIWTRTIQIGGNDFTEALVKAFKLSFAKAEKLKRNAATSKYARQIFQAMRPVFADLAQEIQRSVGHYTSMRREARFKKVLGLGNGFRLPGLQKFLEQQLNIPVVRVDSYNKLSTSPSVNAPTLDENVMSFAVAYGLALQGLELSAVSTNLLPDEILRRRLWGRKRPWFAAAAAVLLTALAGPAYRAYFDRGALAESQTYQEVRRLTGELNDNRAKYEQANGEVPAGEEPFLKFRQLFAYRDFWPSVQSVVFQGLEAVATDQKMLDAYVKAGDDQARKAALARIMSKRRDERRMIFIERIQVEYLADVGAKKANDLAQSYAGGSAGGYGPSPATPGVAAPGALPAAGGTPKRGFAIVLTGRTTFNRRDMVNLLLLPLRRETERIAKAYPSLAITDYGYSQPRKIGEAQGYVPVPGAAAARGRDMYMEREVFEAEGPAGYRRPGMPTAAPTPTPTAPGAAAGQPGPQMPDPLTGEEMIDDTRFVTAWIVSVEQEGGSGAGQTPLGETPAGQE
jgi:type IV pilus assembly protein PilM